LLRLGASCQPHAPLLLLGPVLYLLRHTEGRYHLGFALLAGLCVSFPMAIRAITPANNHGRYCYSHRAGSAGRLFAV
jgi:hypothetical protein